MKVGDLVRWGKRVTTVVEVYESKCWRTENMGKKVNWGEIDPEPFARIIAGEGQTCGVPQADLEVISESR